MIRYALACDRGHGFESWFPDSGSFDRQVRRGLVTCPACGSERVEKAIMSPSIARKTRNLAVEAVDSSESAGRVSAPAPVALMGEEDVARRAMAKALRRHVVENADNVGKAFAGEALRIHHGEIEHRAIYGEASADEALMLEEEGVAFSRLPVLPGDRN